jgi:hypothetical protein
MALANRPNGHLVHKLIAYVLCIIYLLKSSLQLLLKQLCPNIIFRVAIMKLKTLYVRIVKIL